MSAWSLPQVLFKAWFWWAILAIGLVPGFLLRRRYPRPFPELAGLLSRHRKTIVTMVDIVIIGMVLLWCRFLVDAIRILQRAGGATPESPEVRAIELQSSLVVLAVWSGLVAPLLGQLSVFRSDLTRLKRIILFFLCLLPASIAIVALLVGDAQDRCLFVQLAVIASIPTWIANGPRALTGESFPEMAGRIGRWVQAACRGRAE